jgi:hypothetical protein
MKIFVVIWQIEMNEPIMCKKKYIAFNILKLKFTKLYYF